jgi:hypothetical protein
MPSKVAFADIQAYLQAIADNPNNSGDVDQAGHKRFWNVSYADFVSKVVPNETCNGHPISIVGKAAGSPNVDPTQCPFYQALVNSTGWCNKGQMPKFGPAADFITAANFSIPVKQPDGSSVTMTGQQIRANIEWWLTNGLPEE